MSGLVFIIAALILLLGFSTFFRQLWLGTLLFYSNLVGTILLVSGLILIIIGICWSLRDRIYTTKKSWLKEDYKDVEWLKSQYYGLGQSIQDIADDQNVNMMKIVDVVEKIKYDLKV